MTKPTKPIIEPPHRRSIDTDLYENIGYLRRATEENAQTMFDLKKFIERHMDEEDERHKIMNKRINVIVIVLGLLLLGIDGETLWPILSKFFIGT